MNSPVSNNQLLDEGQRIAPAIDPGINTIDAQASNLVMPEVVPVSPDRQEESLPAEPAVPEAIPAEDINLKTQETPGLAQPGQVEAAPIPTEAPIAVPAVAPVEAPAVVVTVPPAALQPPVNPKDLASDLLDADSKNPSFIAAGLERLAYDENPPTAPTPEQIVQKT